MNYVIFLEKSFNLKTESRKQLDGDGSLKVFVLLNKLSELLRILANNFYNDKESHTHTYMRCPPEEPHLA